MYCDLFRHCRKIKVVATSSAPKFKRLNVFRGIYHVILKRVHGFQSLGGLEQAKNFN
jgi:hypothetical protein